MRSAKYLVLAMVLALGACSDDTQAVPDGPAKKDLGTDGSVTKLDGQNLTSQLQAVINKMIMPANDKEYAFNYDNTTAKNKLGAIAFALKSAGLSGFDFQANIDQMVEDGKFLMLMEVLANSLTDSNAAMQAWLGVDKDSPADPTDNFSGTEEFNLDPAGPKDLKLAGKITAGQLKTDPGTLVIVIPAGTPPTPPPQVNVTQCRIEAKLADNPTAAMTEGKIYGVVPWTDVDQKIIPVISESVNNTYTTTTDQSLKGILKTLFDTDADNKITADEVRNSPILKLVLAPDIDTDGDSKPDGMSIGLGFTAVKAVITK